MLVKTEPGFPDTPGIRIPLQRGMCTLVDPHWFDFMIQIHWYGKKSRGKYYACAKVLIDGKVRFLRMHRIVAHTPDGYIPHHLNGNSLDNREANLLNITEYEHGKLFSYR